MLSTADAAALIEGLRANDSAAWDRFARLFYGQMVQWARKWGRDAAAAEDTVQEIFFHMIQKNSLADFRGKTLESLLAFMKTTVSRRAGKAGKAQREIPSEHIAEVSSKEPGPEQIYEVAEKRGTLLKILSQIPFKYRQVLHMHAILGLPTKSIAATLKMKEGTVTSYISRGRTMFEAHAKQTGQLAAFLAVFVLLAGLAGGRR